MERKTGKINGWRNAGKEGMEERRVEGKERQKERTKAIIGGLERMDKAWKGWGVAGREEKRERKEEAGKEYKYRNNLRVREWNEQLKVESKDGRGRYKVEKWKRG